MYFDFRKVISINQCEFEAILIINIFLIKILATWIKLVGNLWLK